MKGGMKFYLMNGKNTLTSICFRVKNKKPEVSLLPVCYY